MTSKNSFPNATLDLVDLRSDTVTRPTDAMFEAMQAAPLGDDVLGDDPTVMRLEELAAEIAGKEEALFVPSGTMGNQIAVAVHTKPGDAMLIEEDAHILYYEVGAPALISGVTSWTLPSKQGVMDPAMIEKRVLTRNLHTPGTTLLCIENTHNRAGGTVIPMRELSAYRELSIRNGMRLHLDGARVCNAAVALDVPVSAITEKVDTVSICLSKGLRSPVGSVLCGSSEFIDSARFWRKRLGGGMRQAGILAACGIISLTKMIDRLAEDHERAKNFATCIGGMDSISVDMATVQTNIVVCELDQSAVFWQDELRQRGVLALPVAPTKLRFVFHADVDDKKMNRAIDALADISKASVKRRA